MKKSIGLTADVSTFNTTLPQTRHLNYFMNTNPRGFAKGGDVSQGIPNYPNPNVTSGFLPMALGFAPGGEVDKKDSVTKVYDFIFGYFKNVLGMDDDEAKENTEETINNSTEEEIENIVQKIPSGPSQEVFDREEEIKGLETPRQPVTPIDTVTATPEPITTRSDRQGAFDNVPMQPLPKISTEQQQREYEDSQKSIEPKPQITPPNDGGITTIKPEKIEPEKSESTNPFDVNGDGVVNFKDLAEAIRRGMGAKFIEELRQFIEGFKGKEEPDEGEKIVPDSPEKIVPDTPEKIVPETPEKIVPDTPEKIVPKPKPDKDGIAELPKVSDEQRRRDEQDKQTGLSVEDQKTLKLAADINAGGDGGIDTLKNKKDVPSWALPMMSAGFAMMASKSPYFMQALGEAGQAGVESYSAQKQAEEDKLDKEAERAYKKSMATYYEGREQKPDIKILTVDGRGVYHKWDSKKQNYISLDKIAVPSDAEIATELETLYGAELWNIKTFDEKQKLITEKRNQYLGIASDNVTSGNKAAEGGGNWLEDWKETIESWNPDKDD
jgi:hypothetical protein